MSKLPHLAATLIALALMAGAIFGGEFYARTVETEYVYALGRGSYIENGLGEALQRAALGQPDILSLYGSSELDYGGQYNAAQLLQDLPTGFTVFEVGGDAAESIITLQELAGAGSALYGKKIAISLSPIQFLNRQTPNGAYAGNFLLLNANELAFSSEISLETKAAAARRMLQYPKTLSPDPVLRFALLQLVDARPIIRILYFAAVPLGKLHVYILRAQDHWQVLTSIYGGTKIDPTVLRQPKTLNWSQLIIQADQVARDNSHNNPYGVRDDLWEQSSSRWLSQKGDLSDREFLASMQASEGWNDLGMLLRAINELGAQPLVLSQPFPGVFFDYRGVSPQARAVYYQRLMQLAHAYNVPEVSFQDHEYDTFFFDDLGGHLSSKGWVYYTQALDAFFHGNLR